MKTIIVVCHCKMCGGEVEVPTEICENTPEEALRAIKRRLEDGLKKNFALHDHKRSNMWGYAPVIGVKVVEA